MVSCNADVARASQRQHAVEDVDSKCHFGCLTLVGLRAQRMTDDPFPPADIGFHQGTPVVPRRFLPTHAAMFGNRLQMPVTRSGRSIGGLTWNRTRTRRHDDRGFGMTGSDRAVDAVLVVCAIAGERGDGTIDLVEQGTDLRAVIDIIGGQRRGDDPPRVGIDADVQFAPRPAPARAVLLDQPFTGAGEFQPSAVHQQMHGFGAGRRSRHRQCLGPPAQRGMVRDGEIETEQADDGADQPFGLPQSQAEHDAQRQRRRDRQGRIVGLTAPRGPWFGTPGRDRLVAEPDRQTATLAQSSIIFRPVRYPIPLPGDVMTAIGIDLERHGRTSQEDYGWGSVLPSGTAQPDLPLAEVYGPAVILTNHREVPLSERRMVLYTYSAPDVSPADPCNKMTLRRNRVNQTRLSVRLRIA